MADFVQYVEKDPDTSITIVQGLVKFWPWANSTKTGMFFDASDAYSILVCRGVVCFVFFFLSFFS
jgi:hypothetical protein